MSVGTKVEIVWRFQRPDGKWMKVCRDDSWPGASQWSEWVDRFDDGTVFPHAGGLEGDHRWKWMLEGAKPKAFTRVTTVSEVPR